MKRKLIESRRRQPRLSVPTSTAATMLDVMVALVPALAMAVYFFGLRVLTLTLVSMGFSVLFEYLYRRLTKQSNTLKDLSACVTGMLLAMCLPPTAPYWAPVLGAFFSVVVAKQFYGGLGRNFMNPALAGRMLLCTFPMLMTTWSEPFSWLPVFGSVDAVSCATPMSYLSNGALPPETVAQLFLGQHAGSIGEVSSLMLLLGGAYLLMRRVISPRIPLSYLGTVALLTFLFPIEGGRLEWMTANLLSGGLLLGAIFMATDYVTSPTTLRGQVIYGIGCGVLTVLLRYFGSYPEGVGWSILTMNCCVWLLDRAGRPRRFGVPPFDGTKRRLHALAENLSQIRLVKPKSTRFFERGKVPGEAYLDQVIAFGRQTAALGGVVIGTVLIILVVHRGTELTTYQQTHQQNRALLQQVMPQASYLTETPYQSPNAVSISAGYGDEALVGYVVEIQVPGFVGSITMKVGVNTDGRVTGVAVISASETLGMGTQALEEDYLSSFVGRTGTIRSSGANAVDTVSGATVSSKAIISGVNQALEVVAMLEIEEGGYEEGEV